MGKLGFVVLLAAAALQGVGQPSFRGTGDLPGGTYSIAGAVSGDGHLTAGYGTSSLGTEAFLWKDGVLTRVGDLPGQNFEAYVGGISTDGSILVGTGTGSNGYEWFKWSNGTFTALGRFRGAYPAWGWDVSADGSVVVGYGEVFGTSRQAIKWENGVITELGRPQGVEQNVAWSVSDDGSAIAGYHLYSGGRFEAFRWENGAFTGLGDLPGGSFKSYAIGISRDGRIIVGAGTTESGQEAARWDSGMIRPLGDLPGGRADALAFALSDDGSVIVGYGYSDVGQEAVLWRNDTPASLKQVLVDEIGLGSQVNGWLLREALAVSADGTVIVGYGRNPFGQTEGFVAVIPEPSTLAALLGVLLCIMVRRRRAES